MSSDNKVGIIGYQGIGAAHAVAVVRSGYGTVTCIVDVGVLQVAERLNQPYIDADDERNSSVWSFRNAWGPIEEAAPCFNLPLLLSDQSFLADPSEIDQLDLWIVAVPNEHKKMYVDYLIKHNAKRILVEKPFDVSGYDNRVSVGLEWIHHPMLDNIVINGPFTVVMFHNEPVQEHYGSAEQDLLPHCMSIAYRLRGEVALHDPRIEYATGHNIGYIYVILGGGRGIIMGEKSLGASKFLVTPGTHIITSDAIITLPWVDLFDLQLMNLDKFPYADRIVEKAIRATTVGEA